MCDQLNLTSLKEEVQHGNSTDEADSAALMLFIVLWVGGSRT